MATIISSACATGMALALLASGGQTKSPGANGPFRGRLYAAVSRWEPANLDSTRDAALVSPALRTRFERFVNCVSAFQSRLPDSTDFFVAAARPRRRVLERTLACSSVSADGAALAVDYVEHARIFYEWEGQYTSPLGEAEYAEQFIDEHPTSPLVPSLKLFVAARMRFAFEMLKGAGTDSEMKSLANQYDTWLRRARAADPLVALMADDLDGLAFVYEDVGKHPRDLK